MDKYIKEVKKLLMQNDITHPPIDIFKIIESCGVKYTKSELPDDISGVFDNRDKNSPYIIVNEDQHPNRQRFSAAHELGHFILHSKQGMHVDRKSFYRNSKSSEGLYHIEIEANRFAAEILMPTKMIKKDLMKFEDFLDTEDDMISELAKKYKVSATAMSFKIQSVIEEFDMISF